jgi:hypothetical protein
VGIDRELALAFGILVHVATLAVTSLGGAIAFVAGSRRRHEAAPHPATARPAASPIISEPAATETAAPAPDR